MGFDDIEKFVASEMPLLKKWILLMNEATVHSYIKCS